MNIEIQLKSERGEVVASSDVLLLIGPQLSRVQQRIPALRAIHPAALTMFNQRERAVLEAELLEAEPGDPADEQVLTELGRLCSLARDEAHLYLWFLGA